MLINWLGEELFGGQDYLFLFIIYIYHLYVCIHVPLLEDNLLELVLSFYYVGPRNHTWVVRLLAESSCQSLFTFSFPVFIPMPPPLLVHLALKVLGHCVV